MPTYFSQRHVQSARQVDTPLSRPIERLSFGAFCTMNKLPQITLAFWVMKICATTLGETAGDLLSMTLNVG